MDSGPEEKRELVIVIESGNLSASKCLAMYLLSGVWDEVLKMRE